MIVFMGSFKEADLLLSFYGVPLARDVAFATLDPAENGMVVGERTVGLLSALSIDSIDTLIVMGGPWTYPPLVARLHALGVAGDKILTGLQPDLIHACLVAFDPQPRNMKSVAHYCVYHDVFARPWYAYPLMLATVVAERMGLPGFCAFEFGVCRGEGLRNMASLAAYLTEAFGIHIRVLGFDAGTGLPSVADWRDHPELWSTGQMAVTEQEIAALRAALPPHAKLYIGDIAQTLEGAIAENISPLCPVGCVSLDVDTYSSSVASLRLFEIGADLLMPVIPLYVDDDYVNVTQTRFAGEGLAIAEFNESHDLRKIDRKIVRTNRPPFPWHHAMCFVHVFDHAMRQGKSDKRLISINHFQY